MSAEIHSGHAAQDHGYDHAHGDMAHGDISLSGYLIGFGLSVVLTAIPFWLVMSGVLGDKQVTALVIMLFAAVQIVVHMIFFLHMNASSEGGWTMMALIFTVVMVVIAMTGSLWVMHHLSVNMMPAHDMSRMQ
jgi:cytochrome o ubiquinol oxidase operon protein cyoD